MTTISATKARAFIDGVICDQLRLVMKSQLSAPNDLPKAKVEEVSVRIRNALLNDQKALENLQVLVASAREVEKEWLTTEEAAAKMGFSRPYATAIFDSTDFFGKVQKSAGGHRRILASAVKDWMVSHGVNFPLSKADQALLEAPVPAEFFDDEQESPGLKESERMAEIEATNRAARSNRPRGP